MQQTMSTYSARRGAHLMLPVQAAPVGRDRSAGAMSTGPCVEADGIFDDIMGVVRTVAPVAGPVLGALGI